MLQELQNDPTVEYVEPASAMVYPDDYSTRRTTTSLSSSPMDTIPYGITMTLGSGVANPQQFVPPLTSTNPQILPLASSFCSIKVAILDSGTSYYHQIVFIHIHCASFAQTRSFCLCHIIQQVWTLAIPTLTIVKSTSPMASRMTTTRVGVLGKISCLTSIKSRDKSGTTLSSLMAHM